MARRVPGWKGPAPIHKAPYRRADQRHLDTDSRRRYYTALIRDRSPFTGRTLRERPSHTIGAERHKRQVWSHFKPQHHIDV